jgi:hypothetical protein
MKSFSERLIAGLKGNILKYRDRFYIIAAGLYRVYKLLFISIFIMPITWT